jgi:hypothetical protein
MNESEGNTNDLGAKPLLEQFKVSDDYAAIENPQIINRRNFR